MTNSSVVSASEIDLKAEAERIRSLHLKGAMAFIEIGEILSRVRDTIPRGQCAAWIRREFQWSGRSVRVYIALYKAFHDKRDLIKDSMLPARTLRLLASKPSADAEVILNRAASGEKISHAEVRKTLALSEEKSVNKKTFREQIKNLNEKLRAKDEELEVMKTEFIALQQLLSMRDRQLAEASEEIEQLKKRN